MGKEWHWSRFLTRGEKENDVPGCMSGMFHYLDFHQLLFTSGHGGTSTSNCGSGTSSTNRGPPLSSTSSSQFKGLEAPRNSLELNDGKAAMSTAAMEEEFYVDVPVGIKVVPVASKRSSSQAETPRRSSVVARLMGLEVLPDQSASSPGACSPRPPPLARKSKQSRLGNGHMKEQLPQRQPLRSLNCNLPALPQLRSIIDANSSLSLPETPRASVSSTRSWDPRLSLQLNNEESACIAAAQAEFRYLCGAPSDCSLPTSPSAGAAAKSRRKHWYVSHRDENKRPSSHHYAREIVKQLKQTVSSPRGGGSEGNGETRARLKKSSLPAEKKGDYDAETQNQRTLSVTRPKAPPAPPPARLSEVHKANSREERDLKPPLPPNYKESCAASDEGIKPLPTLVPNRCRKAAFERFTAKIKKESPAEENSNRWQSFSGSLPTLPLTEKQIASHRRKKHSQKASSTVTSRKKEASALSSRPSPSPSHEHVTKTGSSSLKSSSAPEQDPEYRYLKSILEHARLTESSNASCLRWHSNAYPVDPVLFHQLELELQEDDDEECRRRLGHLRHRWNRKLLFHVVEEILADLLLEWSARRSSATLADHVLSRESSRSLHHLSRGGKSCRGSDGELLLLWQIWARIRSFPEVDCRVVGDIDALTAGDLSGSNTRRLLSHPSVVEEAEDVVAEVEQELLDSLVEETAAWLVVELPRGPCCRRWCRTVPDVTGSPDSFIAPSARQMRLPASCWLF